MMTQIFSQLTIWSVMAAFLLSQLIACGGGGGGTFADGGIGGSGVVSAGVVTAKGSIFVNDIQYSVEGATFIRNGEIVTLSENEGFTQVGMVVELKGTINDDGLTGQATEILFEDVVEGTIDSSVSNTPGIKTLTILAQQVIVEEGLTKFDAQLNYADIDSESGFIEISGFRRPDGTIQATYIELKSAPAGKFEVVGPAISITPDSFMIGSLTVTADSLPSLQSGNIVKAEGTTYDQGTQTLTATSVALQPSGLRAEDADHAEIEGFVSGGPTGTPIPVGAIFQVDGQDVQYSIDTIFAGGAEADLVNSVKVEAEGPLVGGILMAEKIDFEENLKFQSTVDSKTDNSLTLIYPDDLTGTSTIVVLIDPVLTDQETALVNINVGDTVKLEGRRIAGSGGNSIVASSLKVLSPDTRINLQSPLDDPNPAGALITLLGVSIDTSGLNFSDEDVAISEAEFFIRLQSTEGIAVKAEGDEIGGWEELELER